MANSPALCFKKKKNVCVRDTLTRPAEELRPSALPVESQRGPSPSRGLGRISDCYSGLVDPQSKLRFPHALPSPAQLSVRRTLVVDGAAAAYEHQVDGWRTV